MKNSALSKKATSSLKKPRKESKILTGFRLDRLVKELATMAAEAEHRSLSNYIENLIWKDVVAQGFYQSSGPTRKSIAKKPVKAGKKPTKKG